VNCSTIANRCYPSSVVPTSESEQQADWAYLAELLAGGRNDKRPERPRQTRDERAQRATFKKWLLEHTPLVYAGLHNDPLLDRRRRAQLARIARERRAALAYCIECQNPLVATEYGFQYCPYERAGQHEKIRRALAQQAKSPDTSITLDRRRRAGVGARMSRIS
jgi:hypothetical protein